MANKMKWWLVRGYNNLGSIMAEVVEAEGAKEALAKGKPLVKKLNEGPARRPIVRWDVREA